MKDEAYLKSLIFIINSLPEHERQQFIDMFSLRAKNPVIALGLSTLLGVWGIDRFYLGHIWLGTGKLLTLGGFGIWTIVDWFLIAGAARRLNMNLAQNMTGLNFYNMEDRF